MENQTPLVPRKIISVKGKVHYSESNQAWNIIKLKQEFLNEFNQLKEKRSKFSYEFIFSRDSEEVIKSLKDIKEKNIVPVLMVLYRED
jgi:hypothetical protein